MPDLTRSRGRLKARHARVRRSNSILNIMRVLLTAVLVVLVSGAGTLAYATYSLQSKIKTTKLVSNNGHEIGAGNSQLDGELTVLLVGSDSRKGSALDDGETGELNDVNLLLHVPADHKSATVISFPRDLMLPIPSCPLPNGGNSSAMREQQLNTTLSVGGLACTALTIEKLTGIQIPYAALITFDGVINMSDAIGGVQVCLTKEMDDTAYTGLYLPPGDNTLSGWEALQFLRARHGVGDGGDTSRISSQQIFMSAMLRQFKSKDTLNNPLQVFNLAKTAVNNMTMSENMASIQFLRQAASTVQNIDLDRINFVQYPTFSHPQLPGRLKADTSSAQILLDVVKSGKPFNVTGVGVGVQADAQHKPEQGAPGGTAPPAAGAQAGEASGEQAGEATGEQTPNAGDGSVNLPENITGQRADDVTCSEGRTIY